MKQPAKGWFAICLGRGVIMTPSLTFELLRTLFVTFTICVGLMIGEEVMGSMVTGGISGAIFGLGVVLGDRMLKGVSLRIFSSATIGLLMGCIFSQLLLASKLLIVVPPQGQWVVSLLVYSTFSYVGMMLAMRSNRDEFALVIPYVRFRQAATQDAPILIDSNIVIDGRITEICCTGFLSSSLVVPRAVLAELHRLTESQDPLKRERGRMGLERLSRMQADPRLNVTIHDGTPDEGTPVDIQLVKLAAVLDVRLLTNDANICQVARMQGVPVLNLNDLTKALRPQLSVGEELQLSLVKGGRDPHQAVGYLPDGTMVVVNNARSQMGATVPVVIASSLQTNGGRLFFAELKAA